MSDDDDIAALDRDALQRCMDIAKRDRDMAAHLQAKLRAGQTWAAVARSAAYNTQITSLRLRPWQDPPCVVDEDDPEEIRSIGDRTGGIGEQVPGSSPAHGGPGMVYAREIGVEFHVPSHEDDILAGYLFNRAVRLLGRARTGNLQRLAAVVDVGTGVRDREIAVNVVPSAGIGP